MAKFLVSVRRRNGRSMHAVAETAKDATAARAKVRKRLGVEWVVYGAERIR